MLSTLYNHVIDNDSSQPLYEIGIFMHAPTPIFPMKKLGLRAMT